MFYLEKVKWGRESGFEWIISECNVSLLFDFFVCLVFCCLCICFQFSQCGYLAIQLTDHAYFSSLYKLF